MVRMGSLWVPRRHKKSGPVAVLNETQNIVYSTQVAGHAKSLDVKWWSNCTPRPTILIVHAGGWKGFTPSDRFINGAQGCYFILAAMGFNTVVIDYWGYDDGAAYNRNRPHTDVINAIAWCRDAGNSATYNLNRTSVNALGHSAGGHLVWLVTMIGSGSGVSSTRPDTVCSWSGANHFQECEGTFAQGDARHYIIPGGASPYVGNEATWHLNEPGENPLNLGVLNPGIPGRIVGSAAEDTVSHAGVAYTQQTQLITALAGVGYTATEKKFSIANGYSREDLHYNDCGNATYGGDPAINDIVDSVVVGSGYVAWLASHGVTPT